ncbi:MAG: hypothetical protein RLZZ241_166 [Bacteroidota bacterium]|jgi:hypothetical protein
MQSYLNYPFVILSFIVVVQGTYGQQPEAFTRSDFQLRGPVKQLVVKANYGQEQFEFDKLGRLTKSLTRYNETDYDISYYIFSGKILKERRDEVYRDGVCDRQVSIAHIYRRDSITNRLYETLSSYDRSITEQIELRFDSLQRLKNVRRAYSEGIDVMEVQHSGTKSSQTERFLSNGVLHKVIKKIAADSIRPGFRIEYTEHYREGLPVLAMKILTDARGQRQSEASFQFNPTTKGWELQQTVKFTYNADGLIASQTTLSETGKILGPVIKYIYQMDGAKPSNWVRQVTTPENNIVAREIVYY